MSEQKLLAEFDEAMLQIYRRALTETGYNASIFLAMLNERRGLATAKYLLNAPKVSSGYTALWELKRLDLTVEAMILDQPKWHTLFTSNELATCKTRLQEYGYF